MMNKQVNVSDSPEKTTWELGLLKTHMSTTWVLPVWSVLCIFFKRRNPVPIQAAFTVWRTTRKSFKDLEIKGENFINFSSWSPEIRLLLLYSKPYMLKLPCGFSKRKRLLSLGLDPKAKHCHSLCFQENYPVKWACRSQMGEEKKKPYMLYVLEHEVLES